jgi:Flp pilus assembly protein TadD
MILFMLKSFPRRAGRAAIIFAALAGPAMPAAAQYIGGAPPPPVAPLAGTIETPEAALARNIRLIARDPRNFQALVAAGRAALGTGDTQAAVGFFGRAEELSPRSWQPKAGLGAAAVAMGDPQGALGYFTVAQQFGATQMQIAADRGLAFDLMGDQARAQSDYRSALSGADANHARRRLAVSLAISRDIKGAAETIEPLLQRRDQEAIRSNAFILALAGDREGARRTIDSTMPGAGARFEPFFKMLPVLRPAEKAAAIHLGEFPSDAAQRYAQAEPVPISPVVSISNASRPRQASNNPRQEAKKPVKVVEAPRRAVQEASRPSTYMASVRPSLDPSRYASTRRPKTQVAATKTAKPAEPDPEPRPAGRLDDIAKILSEPGATDSTSGSLEPIAIALPPATDPAPEPAFSEAPVSKPKVEAARPKITESKPKVEPAKKAAEDKKKADKLAAERKTKAEAAKSGVSGTNWVQLAGGSNQDRMGAEYRKLATKAGSLLKARSGYVTEGKDYFRLLVGPFPSKSEAQAFVNKLEKEGVDGFSWTRTPAQIKIEKLKT